MQLIQQHGDDDRERRCQERAFEHEERSAGVRRARCERDEPERRCGNRDGRTRAAPSRHVDHAIGRRYRIDRRMSYLVTRSAPPMSATSATLAAGTNAGRVVARACPAEPRRVHSQTNSRVPTGPRINHYLMSVPPTAPALGVAIGVALAQVLLSTVRFIGESS